jgi:hypothetical protein
MSVVYSLITLEVHLILKDRSTNYKKLNTPLINPNRRNASKIKYKRFYYRRELFLKLYIDQWYKT